MPAPIALFVYARPEHARKTLEALSANPEAAGSLLYIFADGPPLGASGDLRSHIEFVRNIAKERLWCGQVEVIERSDNLGLAKSIVSGVTQVVEKHGRVIVLEDDIVVEEGFLSYMNKALDLYETDEQVMQISAYCYPASNQVRDTTYFLKTMSCWGWATWKRAWIHYNDDAEDLLSWVTGNKKVEKQFNLEGAGDYLEQIQANVDGRKSTWAVKWYASCFKQGGYCLYPGGALVRNIGHDGTGVHCGLSDHYEGVTLRSVSPGRIPVKEDMSRRRALVAYYREHITPFRAHPKAMRSFFPKLMRWCHVEKLRSVASRILTRVEPGIRLLKKEGFSQHYDSVAIDSEVAGNAEIGFPSHMKSCIIGDHTVVSPGAWIFYSSIGRFCSIGQNFVCDGRWRMDGVSTSVFFASGVDDGAFKRKGSVEKFRRVKIGNDIRIGANVTVMAGISIGDGAVIESGTVVSKDVPPYAIAAGNPVQITGYRFDEKTIEKLLHVQWWNWPESRLKEVEEKFFDVDGFLETALARGNPEGAVDCRS